jgi:hypothetical protein
LTASDALFLDRRAGVTGHSVLGTWAAPRTWWSSRRGSLAERANVRMVEVWASDVSLISKPTGGTRLIVSAACVVT